MSWIHILVFNLGVLFATLCEYISTSNGYEPGGGLLVGQALALAAYVSGAMIKVDA